VVLGMGRMTACGRLALTFLSAGIGAAVVMLAMGRGDRGGRSAGVIPASGPAAEAGMLAGSASCRACHQRFYELWRTSHHGLAMQAFTWELARKELTAMSGEIKVGQASYGVDLTGDGGQIWERAGGDERRYRIEQVMGGKNVYYFLTRLERGRLQVLPLAYDVRKREWLDTGASAMRHFAGLGEQAVPWRDPLYTFNTSCYGCHVSQLATHYDLKTDTYNTTWGEGGINCETCHGPSGEHVRVCKAAAAGEKPADLKIISTKAFTAEQHNASCSGCHAKASVITNGFGPGDRFFDHFDLVVLESPDFYPDGRDLGENYTYTSWRMNPCAKSGQLHCVKCHTSSGRYRFKGAEEANVACLPCHEERVKGATAHTHHKGDSPGNQCVGCHMPMTEFARMRRSDHSMLPPTPAATIALKSPSACNLCHSDKDAAWADQEVRAWHKEDYQAPVLRRGGLVAAARERDWSKLPEMLAYIGEANREEVFATSLIRLLGVCADARKWPALIQALKDPSPLVRGAAASGLGGYFGEGSGAALLVAAGDEYRLVRIRAADALAGYPAQQLSNQEAARLAAASAELEASLKARPDDWSSQYNLGNYYGDRGELDLSVQAYQAASKLRPDAVAPLSNVALVYARLGRNELAEECLTKALTIEPLNAVANMNLALLRAEEGDLKGAERCLRIAVKSDPTLAQAAYNLAVILSTDRMAEAIECCGRAYRLQPREPKYGYTLAFYLNQSGSDAEGAKVLREVIAQSPGYVSAYELLASIHAKGGRLDEAMEVYRQALGRRELTPADRQSLQMKLRALGEMRREPMGR